MSTEIAINNGNFWFKSPKHVIILLINVKMPTVVAILTFMSGINLMLGLVEHENKFYYLGARSIDNYMESLLVYILGDQFRRL